MNSYVGQDGIPPRIGESAWCRIRNYLRADCQSAAVTNLPHNYYYYVPG